MARTFNTSSPGVYAITDSTNSFAIQAETKADSTPSVFGKTIGIGSAALYGYTTNTSSVALDAHSVQSNAIWAQTDRGDHKYGVQTPDIIRALGYETSSSDVAEYMPVTGDVTPGTVLVIGEDGKLLPSTTAYDTRVAGIVSTDPGVTLGTKENGNPGEQIIAVAGRVPCKVDATSAPIHAGDLLTTSDNPGYAMKAVPDMINGHKYYPDGTVLGKAMGTLESGTGVIEVLVTLQ